MNMAARAMNYHYFAKQANKATGRRHRELSLIQALRYGSLRDRLADEHPFLYFRHSSAIRLLYIAYTLLKYSKLFDGAPI